MKKNWILPPKPGRLLTLVGILAVVWVGERAYRWWRPTLEQRTAHYFIRSSATPEQTEAVGRKVEVLQAAYRGLFRELLPPAPTKPSLLKLNLYRSREEFRRCNRGVGWGEAFYLKPYCHAYFPTAEVSPWQWMVHEAVHQLNREVAGLELAQWADEGVAEYFSTSRFTGERLRLGVTDPNTYPIWWLEDLPLTGDLEKDLAAGIVIPLRVLVSGRGSQDMDREFNRFYLHWWSLVQFLMENEGAKHRAAFLRVLREGASLESFERHLGPVESVQRAWYDFFVRQKKLLGDARWEPANRRAPCLWTGAPASDPARS
jgi:hypothetical protein